MQQSNLGELELSARELRQELQQLSEDKLALHRELSEVQQQLHGKEGADLEPPSAFPQVTGLVQNGAELDYGFNYPTL